MFLAPEEKAMLAGEQGPLKKAAMENLLKYAEVVGALDFCPVTKAHLYCGAHHYLRVCPGQDFHEVFSTMQLARPQQRIEFSETDAACFCQSDVSISDFQHCELLGQSREDFNLNRHYLDMARQAGVMIVGTCAPYLSGWLPLMGEHFVSTESSVTMVANSIWGARGNADGIEAAFWSAICGRTPRFGLHVLENRRGTHLFNIQTAVKDMSDWDLLGKAIGRRLPPNAIPVITGDFQRPDFNILRQFLTTLAISSNAQMAHLVGFTAEAPTLEAALGGHEPVDKITITDSDLAEAYEVVCQPGEGPVDIVSLGCPHYDLAQVKKTAALLEGRRVKPGVRLLVWVPPSIKYLAETNGLAQIIEQAGGTMCSGSCPTTVGPDLLENSCGMVYDSFKMAFSTKNMMGDKNVYMGSLENALLAAESGQWRKEMRWQRK